MRGGFKSSWFKGPLFQAFIIGLIFCLIFGITYRLNQAYLQRAATLVPVVVARRMLPPGTLLTAEDLILSERPIYGMGEDYRKNIAELMGESNWYTDTLGLGKGDILRPSRLTKRPIIEDSLLNRLGKERKQLIAVETDLVRSCANWVAPGTRVDGWVYIKGREGFETLPDQVIGPEDDPCLKNLLIVDKKNKNALQLASKIEAEAVKDPLPVVVTLMLDQTDADTIKALIRYNEIGRIYFSPKAIEEKL